MNPFFKEHGIEIIEVKELPSTGEMIHVDYFTSLNSSEFLFKVPRVANFLVIEGKKVFVKSDYPIDTPEVQLYLNGSVLGACLYQQSIIPFHASCVKKDEETLLFMGDSGMGKSTTCWRFVQEGATFVNDDVCPVTVENEIVKTYSVSNRLKLDSKSLNRVKLSSSKLEKVPIDDKKFFIDKVGTGTTIKVDKIFVFKATEDNELSMKRVNGTAAFEVLLDNLYRREYLSCMPELNELVLSVFASLIGSSKIFQINRPLKLHSSIDICDFIKSNNG